MYDSRNSSTIYPVLLFLLFSVCFQPAFAGKFDSYNGLVMTGYQGWFNCNGDGANRNWKHYQNGGDFRPGHCSIDFWPDVSEYKKTYKTSFDFDDGSDAYVFSSYDPSTTDLHFRWMAQYGIDGAFMQRFTHNITDTEVNNHYMQVFESAVAASIEYNRAICIRYDITGCDVGDWEDLLDDLDELNGIYDFFGRTGCPNYLHHNGKPLIAFGGVGHITDVAGSSDVGYLNEADHIIDGLKARGYSIMVRVPAYWRELRGGLVLTDPDDIDEFFRLIKRCDIIMPWHVGAYREDSYVSNDWAGIIQGDIQWCATNGMDLVPVVYPGFSRYNLRDQVDDGSFRPRNKGDFYWLQASSAIQIGAKQLFVAQFDEMDEGTQIFKCAQEVPVGNSPFVTYDADLEPDHYLWLTGKSSAMLKGEIPFTAQRPERILVTTNQIPQSSFLFPQYGDVLPDDVISVQTLALDYDGTIDHVDLYLDDVYVNTERLRPYTFSVNPGEGVHQLTAIAFDNDGETAAAPITIAVGNVTGYEMWAMTNNIVGDLTDDDDADGLNNLCEYALSEQPVLIKTGGTFDYVYKQRNDDPTLTFTVQVCTNLVTGTWINAAVPVETNGTVGAYSDVSHTIPVDQVQSYIRLRIEKQ